MNEITAAPINRYIDGLLPKVSPAFEAIEKAGKKGKLPLIDRQVGALLDLLCRMNGTARVLEIGTCIGYSTAWLANAVGETGRVTTLEIDQERSELAQANLKKARLLSRVVPLIGDAEEIIQYLEGPYDLIFNDGHKPHYPMVAKEALRLLRKGGLLVSDNALWGGSVTSKGGNADTKAIQAHNEFVMSHRSFQSTLLPIRDGVLIARRA